MNFSRLFRSRWAALWWAGGILWFAYNVARETAPPSAAQTDATGTTVNAADLAILANATGS